jgi:hypothetical protein
MREHHGEDVDGNLGFGEIVRKIVLIGDRAEGLKTDSSAHFSVGWSGSSNHQRLLTGTESLRLSCHRAGPRAEFAANGF